MTFRLINRFFCQYADAFHYDGGEKRNVFIQIFQIDFWINEILPS